MKLKVTLPVYFLILLIEECAEVIQRACKAIRFGLFEKQNTPSGKSEEDNQIRMQGEIVDLLTVIALNEEHGNLQKDFVDQEPYQVQMEEKVKKIKKYLLYSRKECGTITK